MKNAKKTLPKQLQNENLGFVLLGDWKEWKHKDEKKPIIYLPKTKEDMDEMREKGYSPLGKAPFEGAWQKKPYKFNDVKLLKHLSGGKNIGIIGGFGRLRIIDVDDPTLTPYFEKALGKTASQRTGSGGRHFFVFSDYEINHVFAGERGELRAKNYQVVCCPSMHPLEVQYEMNDQPIRELSAEELKKIITPLLREEKTTPIQNNGIDTSGSGLEYRRVIALLRERKTKEEIFKEMMKYSKWAGHGQKHPQYREDTYNKAKSFVDSEGMSYSQKQYYSQFKEPEPSSEEVDLDFYTDEALMSYEPKPQEWIIENQIPEGEIGLLVGKRQDRKTFTALHQALSLAFGKPCFGEDRVPEKRKVLFISEEDSINSLAGRIKILKKGMGLEKEFGEIQYLSFSGLKLDRRDAKFLKFEEAVKDFQPDLIFVDALQRCVTFEVDKDNQKISEFFTEVLRPMQKKYGCGWLLVHHLRKSPTGKSFVADPLDEIRGGSELVNYCRYVLMCQKPHHQKEGEGEMIVFRILKMSNSIIPPAKVISFTPEGEGLKVVYEGEPEEILAGGQQCANAIKDYLFDKGITKFKTKEINDVAEEIGFKKTLISQGLTVLVEQNFLTRVKRGNYEIAAGQQAKLEAAK